jgi:hypothetical protein
MVSACRWYHLAASVSILLDFSLTLVALGISLFLFVSVYNMMGTGSGDEENDYESAQKGGNRYATILLYMSDLDEHDGGETVFVEAWPGGLKEEDRIPMSTVRILQK